MSIRQFSSGVPDTCRAQQDGHAYKHTGVGQPRKYYLNLRLPERRRKDVALVVEGGEALAGLYEGVDGKSTEEVPLER